ncbi:MAG: long-chain acyl-CoA synthetase [Solirubrobacteraceae bacterium]|nr:long-chain acyl-CoA synthetase [Solirubrobacteraceae bacterium]
MATATEEGREAPVHDAEATTMCAAFQFTAAQRPDAVALRNEDGSIEHTWQDYADHVERIAGGLAKLGVGRGDTVALYMGNRCEFQLVDAAAVHLGATPFSVYGTSSPEQVAYVFENAQSKVAVIEDEYRSKIPDGVEIVDVAELDQLAADDDFDFEAAWRAVEPGDVLTLIYTSGTTGPPKGVQLTHANMHAQCRGMGEILPFRPGARITSYLPSAHIADRWSSHYSCMYWGIQITNVADARKVAAVLPDVKPQIWGGVPRVFEKIASALGNAIKAMPDEQRNAIEKGMEAGKEIARLRSDRKDVPDDLQATFDKLDEAALSKVRAKIGLDECEWIVCGAAPLSLETQEFLLGLGLPLVELYGMSELSCCVSCATPDEARIGYVGPAIPGVEAKLDEDGELLFKGPTVMKGYRNDPEKTDETIDADGWLHTGDICEIDSDGQIKIVDRKKELIINAGGKNMSPANIEQHLKDASPLIGQAVAIGDGRPYNVALLVLDPDAKASWDADKIESDVADAVESANAKMARVEQIKKFELLEEDWEPGGDELTPTMKLKRKPIAEKYQDEIEALYSS